MNTNMRIILLEKQKLALEQENAQLKAKIEYVAAMDYPELLEEEENGFSKETCQRNEGNSAGRDGNKRLCHKSD